MVAARHAEYFQDQLAPKRLSPKRLVWDGILIGVGVSIAVGAAASGGSVGNVLLGCMLALMSASDLLKMKDGILAQVVANLGMACAAASMVLDKPRDPTSFVLGVVLLAALCVATPLWVRRMQRVRRSVSPLGSPVARA